MTKEEFAKFVSAIKAYYQGDNLFKHQEIIALWYAELQDIDYEMASRSLRRHVQTSPYVPKISDIRQGVAEIVTDDDWSKGYADMMLAVRKFGYMQETLALESLDEITRETTRRIGWRSVCESDNPEVMRAQFRMIYEQIASKKKTRVALSNDVQQLGMIEQEVKE